MREWVRDLPLATKLRVIIVYAAMVALVTVSALYISGEVLSLRHSLAAHLQILVTTVGENTTGALTFGDRALARKMLASLRADPNVTSVTLYDVADTPFVNATFGDAPDAPVTERAAAPIDAQLRKDGGVRFKGLLGVDIQAPVILDGERIGTIQLKGELHQLYTELQRSIAIMWIGLLVAAVVAYALSTRLQRVVSEPIRDLLEVTRTVRTSKDFSIRGVKQAGDEIGALIDGFNDMLAELEERDHDLRRYHDDLERRVEERTERLDIAVAESRAALSRAEAASQAKSEFLATMSHEIRTPLNGVLGMNELLLRSELNARQREWAGAAQASGQHLLGVINDILDFSKIESGHMKLEDVEFSLVDLIDDTLAMFGPAADRKGLALRAEYPPNGLAHDGLRGDPFRLRQVLANLLGNAVKFTERGGVTVQVSLDAEPAGHSRLHLCIVDTGIGIALDAQARIFESFSQADGSTTRRYGGTGLGLAICRRLLSLMGGGIRVESTPGEGTRFHVDLRLPTAPATCSRRRGAKVIAGARVLVVEARPTDRTALARTLEGWHLTAGRAAGVDEALRMLSEAVVAQLAFDAVVFGASAPGPAVREAASAIRRHPEFGAISILVPVPVPAADGDGPPRWQPLEAPANGDSAGDPADLLGALCIALGSGDGPARRRRAVPPADGAALDGSVLLVEDNPINQEVAMAMLHALGLEVRVAKDGREALELAGQRDFDAVLMDCQMPVMDGFEATAAMRALPGGRGDRLPIIALTANAMAGDELKCLNAGMNGFLAKPFTFAQLRATLSRWLPTATRADGPAPAATASRDARAASVEAINMQTLDALRAIDGTGGRALMNRVLHLFLESADEALARIDRALLDGDATRLSRDAHALKSSAANVGADALAAIYRQLDRLGREGRLKDARPLVDRVRSEQARVLARVREILEEPA